jgi:hypothetical protein
MCQNGTKNSERQPERRVPCVTRAQKSRINCRIPCRVSHSTADSTPDSTLTLSAVCLRRVVSGVDSVSFSGWRSDAILSYQG